MPVSDWANLPQQEEGDWSTTMRFWGERGGTSDIAPAEYAGRAHKAGLAVGRSVEEHEKILKEHGFSPSAVQQLRDSYRLDLDTQNLGRYPGGRETILGSIWAQEAPRALGGEEGHAVPFRSLFVNTQKEEQEAAARFQAGQATDKDFRVLALAKRRYEDDARIRSTFAGELIAGLRDAPAVMGEYLAGSALMKGAGILQAERVSRIGQLTSGTGRFAFLTAAMPTGYADLARQKNVENGRDPSDWRGYPPAALHAFAHVVVLGRVFRSAAGIEGGLLPSAVRSLQVGGKGAFEFALADEATRFADLFVPKAYKIHSGQGVFEHLMNGEVSKAGRKFAMDTLTLAAYSGLHRIADGLSPAEAAQHAEQLAGRLALDAPEAIQQVTEQMKGGPGESASWHEHVKHDARFQHYANLRMRGIPHEEAYARAYAEEADVTAKTAPELSGKPTALPKGPESLPAASEPQTPPRSGPPALEVGNGQEGGIPAEIPKGERYYRVPGSKGPADNVDAVIGELIGDKFAGKWFSRTREGNEGYMQEGRAQLEFHSDRLGGPGDHLEIGERDVLMGGTAPMYMHPGLTAVRFKGSDQNPQYQKLARLVEEINTARSNAGLEPVLIEASQMTRPTVVPDVAPLVKFLSGEQLTEIDPAKAGKWLARGLMRTPGVKPTDAEALVSLVKGESTREAAETHGVSHETVRTRADRAFEAAKKHWGGVLDEFANASELASALRQERRGERGGFAEFGKSFLKKFMQARREAGERSAEEVEGIRRTRTPLRSFLEGESGTLDLEAMRKFLWKAGDWIKWMVSGGKGNPPDVKLDPNHIFPDPQDWSEYKKIVSEPQGFGRIPLIGWLFDPARNDATPEGEAMVGRAAMKEMGKNVGALWAAHETVADKLFGADAKGQYARTDGSKGFMADDIEAEMRSPNSVAGMGAEQRAWIKDVWTPALRDLQRLMRKEGVKSYVDEDGNPLSADAQAYFPRQAVGRRNRPDLGGAGTGGRPGAKAHFEQKRRYESEAEGSEDVIYDPSPRSRVARFISEVYRSIGDHHLANDPALGGETPTERFDRSKANAQPVLDAIDAKYAGQGKAGREQADREKADILNELWDRASNPAWTKGETFVRAGPAFQGKIYPAEIAAKIEKMYAQEQSDLLKRVEVVSAAAKGITLGADASFMFIQLLPTMFRHPIIWARSVRKGIESIWDKEALSKYLADPTTNAAARDGVQLGRSFGRLQDFLSGLGEGQFATKIPVLGRLYEATGRAFGVAMDVAWIELWKAWKPTKKPHEYRQLAEDIDTMLLTGRMEGIGLNPRRVAAERVLGLAPSYYRGGNNFIATAFMRRTGGHLVRQALGATIAGVAIVSVSLMKAVGLSDDEIEERLNPERGKFLKVPVELGDGQKLEVGFGNILTSYVRLLGAGADYLTSDRPVDTGADGNPILRWLRGKAAFSPRLMIDLWTGKDYFGQRQEPHEALLRAFEPLAVQQMLYGNHAAFEHGIGGAQLPGRANVADALTSLLGLTSFAGSDADSRLAVYDKEARQQFSRPFAELSIPEQGRVVKAAQNRPDMPAKTPSTPDQMERAFNARAERAAAMLKGLSEENRKKLSELGEDVPAPLAVIHSGGADVPLSNSRMKAYEGYLIAEYDAAISRWDVGSLRGMTPEARKRWIDKQFQGASERGKRKLIAESQTK